MKTLAFKIPEPAESIYPGAPVLTFETYLGQCGMPPRVRGMTAAAWRDEWKPVPEACIDWKGEPSELTLMGKPGLGKTHLASMMFQRIANFSFPARCEICTTHPGFQPAEDGSMVRCECREQQEVWRKGILWVDVPDAIEELKSLMNSPAFGQKIDRIHGASLVVLDDVGAEMGEWGKELVPGWIRWRYNQMLPTIVTCNAASLTEFRQHDPRTASRLSEGLAIELGGADRRPEVGGLRR